MRGLPGDLENEENPIMPNDSFQADAASRRGLIRALSSFCAATRMQELT
jgi:hypothetical protein